MGRIPIDPAWRLVSAPVEGRPRNSKETTAASSTSTAITARGDAQRSTTDEWWRPQRELFGRYEVVCPPWPSPASRVTEPILGDAQIGRNDGKVVLQFLSTTGRAHPALKKSVKANSALRFRLSDQVRGGPDWGKGASSPLMEGGRREIRGYEPVATERRAPSPKGDGFGRRLKST
jgi:hypothetical protein